MAPEVNDEHVAGVGDVGGAEAVVEVVLELVDRDVAVPEVLGIQAVGLETKLALVGLRFWKK